MFKKFMHKILAAVVAILMSAGLCSCGGGSSLKLDKSELSLFVGDTYTLVATYNDEKPSGTVGWLTSKKDVATVDKDGLVTAVSLGEATITAEYTEGASVNRATCKVTVSEDTSKLLQCVYEEKASTENPDEVTSGVTLKFYNTGKVKVEMIRSGYVGSTELTYTASGSSITASMAEGEYFTLNANEYAKTYIIPFMALLGVTMGEQIWVGGMKLNLAADILTVSGLTYLTEESKAGANTTVDTYATFTLTAADAAKLGVTLAQRVEVESFTAENPYGADGHKQEVEMIAGEVRTVNVAVLPANATINTYSAVTSDEKVAVANVEKDNGVVRITAVAAGTANVVITADGDTTKSVTIAVKVNAPAADVVLVKGSATVKPGVGTLGYSTMQFKSTKKFDLSGVYFVTIFKMENLDYSITDGKISFNDTTTYAINPLKVTSENPSGLVQYDVKFAVTSTDGFDFVKVTGQETGQDESTAVSFGEFYFSKGTDGDFSKI